ncbi:hypothetical protein Vretimale_11040 [Volvox reticuliferus]|uniref:Uncharacterized protein n=1 Tax=Volvox reticuliferus TaxID=1737510 RepID=A0A8J4FPW2_9CHLO|nr:hypothetical protein Vretifemale_12785 [Volvox reticuliferus]GIM06792.1 hypothetical protein Vretimale_11040 [Volvox reticuliferus]
MAARVLAQVLVAGATVLFRAASQAWGQALVNAQKSGVASEAAQAGATAARKAGQMALQEAHMILGVDANAPWGEVVKRFKHLFDVNEKHGSFYLQSKVYRAKECIEEEYKRLGLYEPGEKQQQDAASDSNGQRDQ